MSTDPIKPRKAADKSARTRAREFALQALYQYLVGRNDAADVDAFTRDLSGFHKADSVHYDALLHGCTRVVSVKPASRIRPTSASGGGR